MARHTISRSQPPASGHLFQPPAYGHFGNYVTFEAAAAECAGYQTPEILESTLRRTQAIVQSPKLAPLDIRLLAALEFAQLRVGPLSVLDFGGAMGTHYLRLKHFLEVAEWTVCELPATATYAAQRLELPGLRFISDPTACTPNVVLASGSLQYAQNPYVMLAALKARGARYMILDRVPILDRQRLTVQRVPPEIFDGSFPAWFFGRDDFRRAMQDRKLQLHWTLPEHPAFIDGAPAYVYEGFVFSHS